MKKRGMKGLSFWDVLAWIALAGIILWLVLKVLGIIQTPLWLEYSPIFGVVYIAGWAMQKLDRATEDIREIKDETKRIDKDMNIIRTKCKHFK